MGRKKAKTHTRIYRRNPDLDRVPFGLPHKDADFRNSSRMFLRDYDLARAKGELAEIEGVIPTKEVAKRVASKGKKKRKIAQKKHRISEFAEIIDFAHYFETLANFQYDLEGLLVAIKGTFGTADARQLYGQYDLVYRKCKALVAALKMLDRPTAWDKTKQGKSPGDEPID